jgi:hypothetical protein
MALRPLPTGTKSSRRSVQSLAYSELVPAQLIRADREYLLSNGTV